MYTSSSQVFARPEVEMANAKKPSLPMTPLLADIRLPNSGHIEIELWPHNPVCVYAEMVELDLSDLKQRNLANIYAFRNRYCVCEGIMNPLLNDVERLDGFQEQGFEFPKEGNVSFTYVVTRPKKGLLKARDFSSTFFCLELNSVKDYKLATALRTMCLGVNSR